MDIQSRKWDMIRILKMTYYHNGEDRITLHTIRVKLCTMNLIQQLDRVEVQSSAKNKINKLPLEFIKQALSLTKLILVFYLRSRL